MASRIKKKYRKDYLIMLLFLAIWTMLVSEVSSKCKCQPYKVHLQTQYCNADYVVRAKIIETNSVVLKKGELHMEKYNVNILKVFKGNIKEGPNIIWSPKIPDCESFMPNEAVHLIFGQQKGSQLQTTYCDLNPTWLGLTTYQLQGLNRLYGETCGKCQVKFCDKEERQGKCAVPWCCNQINTFSPKKDCILVSNFPETSKEMCYKRHSICVKKDDKDELCDFKQSKELMDCLEQEEQIHNARQKAQHRESHSSSDKN